MKKFLIAILFVTVFGIILFSTTTFAASRYIVTADYLRVRIEPSGEIVGKLKYGTIVEVLELRNDWAKIFYNNKASYGYVWSEYLVNIDPPVVEKSAFVVKEGNAVVGQNAYNWLNVRKKMSKKSNCLSRVIPGDELNVIEIAGKWAKIEARNGKIGYVMLEFIEQKECYYCNN